MITKRMGILLLGASMATSLSIPITASTLSSAQTTDNAIPAGMISAFAGNCPSGWSNYGAANGRTLVGDGYFSQSYRGQDFSKTYSIGEKGGVRRFRLAGSEIPSNDSGSVAGNPCDYAGCSGVSTRSAGHSGYGAAFDNMGPYLVVNYCRKN